MLFHLLVVLKLSPFKEASEDMTSFLSSLTLTLTTIGGFALMTDDSASPTFDAEVLAIVLISISVCCIASQIGITVFVDCGLWSRMCGGKRVASINNVRVLPTSSRGALDAEQDSEDEDEKNNLRKWET